MTIATTQSTITEHEAAQVQRANASGATPIVFVHGLWLLPSSWDRWVTLFGRRLCRCDTRLARRSRDRRRSQRASGGVRGQGDPRDRRLPGGHHPPPESEARDRGPLFRRSALP
jgi:hypothetical protein